MVEKFIKKYLSDNPIKTRMYFFILENKITEDAFLLQDLFNATNHLGDATIKERIFHIINGDSCISSCLVCNNPTKFISVAKGYERFCSKKCRNKNPELRKNISDSLKEYHKNLTIDEKKKINDKTESTNIEKYGVKRPAQNEDVKNKTRETNLKKYGVSSNLQTKESKEKLKNSMFEKYGVDHISKTEKFKEKIKKSIHENTINNLKIKYKELKIINYENGVASILCDKCHSTYLIDPHLLFYRHNVYKINPCLNCNPLNFRKGMENDFIEFILSISKGIEYQRGNRSILNGKEIDLYFPDLSLAFEFNGIYWHSDSNPSMYKNYHKEKKDLAKNTGIELIHIYEDEWINKRDIVESIIKNKFGLNTRIFARKCSISKISKKDSDLFLKKNHIQGSCISLVRYGLFYEGELVSVMTFSNLRKSLGKNKKNGSYELSRFCNKIGTNVIGGASRLFKKFLIDSDPEEILSYANYDRSLGGLYYKLGFKYIKNTQPGYWYILRGKRYHRFNFRKNILVSCGHSAEKKEKEIMIELGYSILYDSGNIKFLWSK